MNNENRTPAGVPANTAGAAPTAASRVPRGTPTGGQFATSTRTEPDVALSPPPALSTYDLFDDWRDAEDAADFDFDWRRMDFDDYNGYTAYDPAAPRLTQVSAKDVRVGDSVHIPGTTSIYRPAIKIANYTGGSKAHLTEIWTMNQDPLTDEPAVSVPRGDLVSTKPFRPEPNLADPAAFRVELARRVYSETAAQASNADENHDVERLARQIAEDLTPALVAEALAQRAR